MTIIIEELTESERAPDHWRGAEEAHNSYVRMAKSIGGGGGDVKTRCALAVFPQTSVLTKLGRETHISIDNNSTLNVIMSIPMALWCNCCV